MKLYANIEFSETMAVRGATIKFDTITQKSTITELNHQLITGNVSDFIVSLDVAIQFMWQEDYSIYQFTFINGTKVVVRAVATN
jgi:predicted metal-dependent phosphotriesterase family hydrolase